MTHVDVRTRTTSATRPAVGRTTLLFAACGAAVGLLRIEQLADANVLWETRDGLTILSTGHLPRHDTWSWVLPGHAWTPNSWGWDVVLGAVHRAAGGAGLAALDVVLTAALFAVLGSAATRRGALTGSALAIVGGVGGAVLMPWVIVRPQLVGYLFIAAVVPLARRLMQARNRELIRWWVVAFAGEMVWVNLHLFAVIGPVLLTVACLGLALQRRSGLPRVVAAAVVSVAASALTPYGPIAAAKAISVHDNVAGVAIEWRPAGFATFSQFTAVLALGLAVVAARSAWQRRDVAALPVLAVLAVGAAMACRMAPALAVVALPDAAAWFSVGKVRRRGVAGVGVVVALLGAGVFVTGLGRLGQLATGTDSAALVRRIPHGCHTLNDYELGGTLIFFRPDVRVSIDSRTDLYGRRRIDANAAWLASSSDAAIRALDARGVDCVIAPTSDALVRTLAGDAAWRKAGADAVRSLYVRR